MKFNIEQRELSKHIGIAQKAISSRSSLQILDGIKLEAKDNKLKIQATDLEISIETYADCQVEKEGSIVINSRIFGDIIRKLPSDTIYIDTEDTKMNIRCQGSNFNLIGNKGEEYPDLPIVFESANFPITKEVFKEAVRQTVFATSQEETRPSLTGVLLEIDEDEISFVALDGYRLALKKIKKTNQEENKIIIPSRTLNEIIKIIEDDESDMEILFTRANVVFKIGDTTLYSRLLEGDFFNYKDIIRSEYDSLVKVNRRELQLALERASLLAKEERANLVRLVIGDGKLEIKSNSEIGDVNEEVEASVEGQSIEIAFNSRYLLDGIKAMEAEELRLEFKGELNPCIIKPISDDDYLYLALPVRLARRD